MADTIGVQIRMNATIAPPSGRAETHRLDITMQCIPAESSQKMIAESFVKPIMTALSEKLTRLIVKTQDQNRSSTPQTR